jgi:hypothetical protein
MAMTADVETGTLLEAIRRDGFVVLERFFTGSELERLQADADWFLANPQGWFELIRREQTLMAKINPQCVPKGQEEHVRQFQRVFSQPAFLETCLRYMERDAYVNCILIHKEQAGPKPVTLWHADQATEGRLSFKFMLYLNDCDALNGAFSYAPGSHRVVHEITEYANARGIDNLEVHGFERIRALAHEFGLRESIGILDELSRHIQGDYESDDHYTLSAPRGSVVLFDTKGIHRGGVVSQGERYILRVHCFEPPPLSWKGKFKRMVLTPDRRTRFFPLGGSGADWQPVKEYE